ncbi:Universal stress protein YxiE [Fasciola hepatica]|uniref:Universal stress protein YxiE n=1 Tax=Fasciola hepatica TaxID=6192 RepID=A0A2H1CKT2_FASHE|nr:Universal stress protein YxiE [Fasciola hepatica]
MPLDNPTEHSEQGTRRTVILPVDQSQHSKRARQWYFKQVMQPDDLVFFVHVVEPIHPKTIINVATESVSALAGTTLQISKESINEGKQLCRDCMQEATEQGVNGRSFLYVDTKPGVALTRAIHELKGDLVVVGNRGAGKLQRTFLGSVSGHIVNHTNVPVAVVPPPARKNSIAVEDDSVDSAVS